MQCKWCKMNVITIILSILLMSSLAANIWLLQQMDYVYHKNDTNSWVTPKELELIKKEIERLENLNK